MPNQKHPHILLPEYKQAQSYTPKGRKITLPPDIPFFEQQAHGAELERAYNAALRAAEEQYRAYGVDPAHADKGVAVELKFRSDASIDVTTLENAQGGKKIEVLNVKLNDRGKPESAILYIPPNRKQYITKQIDSYKDPTKNKKGAPSNYKKYDKTSSIEPVSIDKLWIDIAELPEDVNQMSTWEVWLRDGEFEAFKEIADELDDITVSVHSLSFPERQICSVHSSLSGLAKIEVLTKAITGFRYLRTQSGFFDSMPPVQQRDWQQELSDRLQFTPDANTSVCVLDTGLSVDHPLISPAIAANGVDSCNVADWGTEDHHGHGTEMAGIALFGDLTPLLESSDDIVVNHVLESVKVFPRSGQNDDDHVGYITAQAVSRAEVNRPDLTRVFCLSWAIAHEEQKNGVQVTGGKPTPLSARIDQLAFGVEELDDWRVDDEKKRLLVVAAGNIEEIYNPDQYPDINDIYEIEEPAQAWNALTVGAYTEKTFTTDPSYDGWSPVAGAGQLSPKSRTSVLWGENYWPTKPDIVLEGGNYLANGSYMEDHPDTCPLTTDKDRIFCCTRDTSAANAEASRLSAMLSAQYPEYWPETIRGLMVHFAEWTNGMLNSHSISGMSKAQKIAFIRRNGYGVPQRDNLINSLSNRPCIVIQDYLTPFAQSSKGTNIVFNDMNYYELPWPREELEQIYHEQVKLRITLSYFIEPNPSERPPKTKYSYASHELRFKLNRPNESENAFLARINKELQIEEINEDFTEEYEISDVDEEVSDQDNWLLGPHTRDRGGVISDIWQGTGAELAGQNMIAVVPQLGWWKYRKAFPLPEKARYNQQVRYALILSLISEADIDLYTPITQQIGIPTQIIT